MAVDAPDWQRIVTTVSSTGAMSDAPDWTRVVVGPGGTPIGGGGGGQLSVVQFGNPSNVTLNPGQFYESPSLIIPATGQWVILGTAYFTTNTYGSSCDVLVQVNPVESNYTNSTQGLGSAAIFPQSTFNFDFYDTPSTWFYCQVTALPQHFYLLVKNASGGTQPGIGIQSFILTGIPIGGF